MTAGSNYGLSDTSVLLATFISGYIMCLFDLTGYLCRFDYDFQIFVENKTGQCDCHWDTILSRDRTNEESFRYFYQLLREFLDEVGYHL